MKTLRLLVTTLFLSMAAATAHAETAAEIDAGVDATLAEFKRDIAGASSYLDAAKAVLVFPSIVKGGFVFGGEYGEGALRIDGKSVDYWSTAGASFGFQFGVAKKSLVMLFMDEAILKKFRAGPGFEVGVDGNVALMDKGKAATVNSSNVRDPIVAFVISAEGLMVDVSLDGSKFTRLDR